MSDYEVCDFVWQYEQRKKWMTFPAENIQAINEAVQEKKKDILLPSENSRKQYTLDFDKMVQRNTVSFYEQSIRCLISNNGFFSWVWYDDCDKPHCFKPLLTFNLEANHCKKESTMEYFDKVDYEVNFDACTLLNKQTSSVFSIKRIAVDLSEKFEPHTLKVQFDDALKRISTDGPSSAKRIKLDASICVPASSLSLLNDNLSEEEEDSQSVASQPFSVDLECPERENYHIFHSGETVYSATLNQTNLQNNNNKFYIIQLLQHNQKKLYQVWRRWGRVGQRGQTDLSNCGGDLKEAIKSFELKFYDKTKNHWADIKNFTHVKGKYDLLEMDLGTKKVINVKSAAKSTLDIKIQALLEMICDQKKMEEIMKEMSFDTNKTPLGKLTLKQVREGYVALNKVAEVLNAGGKGTELINACNDFYTKIPHNFGMKTPPLIRTQTEIDFKLKMLEALSNITIAMDVMNTESIEDEHPLDKYYRTLDCSIEAIQPTSVDFMEFEKCLKGTHGPTHSSYEMEIMELYKCCKPHENQSVKNFDKKMLLWHGSRLTNWLGILKQGLRVAPPEAPPVGYMFGKGIYFADVSSKSANYCFATKRKNEGLLLMCEVSVGNQFPLTEADEAMPKHLPYGFNSVLGKGRIFPSSFKTGVLSPEAEVPVGPLIVNESHVGTLHYNEYIVYDVKQVKMKYLAKIKFNFK